MASEKNMLPRYSAFRIGPPGSIADSHNSCLHNGRCTNHFYKISVVTLSLSAKICVLFSRRMAAMATSTISLHVADEATSIVQRGRVFVSHQAPCRSRTPPRSEGDSAAQNTLSFPADSCRTTGQDSYHLTKQSEVAMRAVVHFVGWMLIALALGTVPTMYATCQPCLASTRSACGAFDHAAPPYVDATTRTQRLRC
ncbi:hypothetical protein FH972_025670 [Carpinus fangiana]|uniref:Uncharacterized protein n=1 Tax=Carpinus fangiana TaxID=176857 RepID=A0A5N6L226_9ROSI|nr:hypothetical protein FH972_025670 [Carpinus fangiana]